MRKIAETARIPHDMVLPRLAARHLRERYPGLVEKATLSERPPVAYFHGCAANYLDDGVGDAVIAVLRQHGLDPALPKQRCAGTPIQTYGHTRLVKEGARENLQSLAPYKFVVTGCASCTLMLKDYPSLFEEGPERQAAQELARRVRHISEIVADASQALTPKSAGHEKPRTVTYHSSCHLRAAGVTQAPRQVLAGLPGFIYVEMENADRCAGGAGTYILKDYDTAQNIFQRKQQAIAESSADVVATSCPACMIQLKNGLRGRAEVKHVAELLRDAYTDGPHREGQP